MELCGQLDEPGEMKIAGGWGNLCHLVQVGILVVGEFMPFSKHTLNIYCIQLCADQLALGERSAE